MPKLLDLRAGDIAEAPEADLALANDIDLMTEELALEGVSSLRLELPAFKDGRAFTQVRVLRERHGFTGEIRVAGHVIPDQALMLHRLGADKVEITDESRAEDFRATLSSYRFAYQRPVREEPAFALRRGKA
ncbi:DUF934 domain-containing protein [Parvularcula sp. ZS-1/3]|uniref:DUF934 domain-containing protein n=1 Tax=Parvularcula mediterranea TaxID=2732508 RepID=A0A7Y3W518_9PROT|nr:DUF934 domain-containing protein [Parvularcula mediterranea]NNU15771.1 DUF934 domain-containing protein [Parvularcula mediterranea]